MSYKHNPYDLKEGQIVMLDNEFSNRSEVVIYKFTPKKLFATVYAKNDRASDMWQVMTYRLTPIL